MESISRSFRKGLLSNKVNTINPTIYNIICWFAGLLGQMTRQPNVPSIFFFVISCKILCKNGCNVFILFYYKLTKIKTKSFDAWSTSHLSQQPSEPAYYIVDCWISSLCDWHNLPSRRVPTDYNWIGLNNLPKDDGDLSPHVPIYSGGPWKFPK